MAVLKFSLRDKTHFLVSVAVAGSLSVSCARTPQGKEAAFLKSAQQHARAGDFARAILDFKNAAQAMPNDPEPHYQLGLTYAQAGNLHDSVTELSKTVELDPKHAAAQLKMAEIMILNKKPEVVLEGKRRAQQALEISPGNPDALHLIATAELRAGDLKSGVQHLEDVLRSNPQYLKASVTLAMVKLQGNDAAGAEEVMRKAAQEAPQSAEHGVALGKFYQQIHRSADAEKQFRHALELDPKYGPGLTALAELVYVNKNPGEAEQLFQRAAALPDKTYRSLHAAFLFQIGQPDAAVAEFERISKADPKDRNVRTGLVSAYLRTGRTEDADKILAQALKQDPKDLEALMQRGELRLATGRNKEAEADIAGVLHQRPDSADAHLVMAKIHQAGGARDEYRHELSEVLRVNPKAMATRVDLAHSWTVAGSPETALAVLDEAPPEDLEKLPMIVERNAALYAQGNYAEMRKGVDKGLAISRDMELVLQDGLLRLKQNDAKGGRASLEEVLKWQGQEWRALEALALSYAAEKNLPKATAVVRDHTERYPNSAPAQLFLGTWLARWTVDRAGARYALLTARSANPDPKSTQAVDLQLAELDLRDGNLDSARNSFLTLLRAQPDNLAVLLDLAQAELHAGHVAQSIDYYEKAMQVDPKSLAALNNLAYLLADTGRDPDRALLIAQRAKQLAPDNGTVDDTLGWAYYNKGQFDQAVKYLTLSKAQTPRWKCQLAMAYAKTGNRQQAGVFLQAALKEDPSLPEIRKVQALLAAK